MKKIIDTQLKRKVLCEADKIRKEVKSKRKGKEIRDKDYPKVIIGAKYNKICFVGRSHSGTTGSHRKQLPPILNKALERAGDKLLRKPINPIKVEFYKDERYFFGTCAEDDASSKIIDSCGKYCRLVTKIEELKKIDFTTPLRPKTLQKKNYCKVCKQVFF